MHKTTRRAYTLYVLVAAFVIGVVILMASFVIKGGTWASNKINGHVFTNGALQTAGTIYDRNGVVLAKTTDGKRTYANSSTVRKATLHAVGDPHGFIATGMQTVYKDTLAGYSLVDGYYQLVQEGKANDITTSLDAEVCAAAYKALDGRNGTVGIYNYKTGEIVCMVSTPTYDIKSRPDDINNEQKYPAVYLNRFLGGVYTPGSTFKMITAMSAIENIPDLYNRTFTCTGTFDTGDGKVICNDVHGTLNFETALNRSCNSVFAQLALELGPEKLTDAVRMAGFAADLKIDRTHVVRSSFDVANTTKEELGWAGIGQFTTLVSPCRMMLLAGAIANGGTTPAPTLISHVTNSNGNKIMQHSVSTFKGISILPQTAQQMQTLLRSNVVNYYKDSRFPNLKMCGKTGTAQVDGDQSHAWFVGFCQREDFPYAVVVVAEHSGSGQKVATRIANKALQALLDQNHLS